MSGEGKAIPTKVGMHRILGLNEVWCYCGPGYRFEEVRQQKV